MLSRKQKQEQADEGKRSNGEGSHCAAVLLSPTCNINACLLCYRRQHVEADNHSYVAADDKNT